ncbi:probable D-amino-acid oxidase [Phialocephala subalpina]|uniref:D-amino-acid oxidase n=1 Tax=Phialocephala subalpina TaxID=576137 RepID=A0A1L7XII4_9HELO|nr:probable D-amino-acid oxidase [Phialocephala subalpina]
MPNIVVVGAGVSGLTTALLLSKNPEYKVTIVAKHMPGDYDIEYTSPWAGANYLPVSNKAGSRWEKDTWPELERLARDIPEAGIHFQDAIIYNRTKDAQATTGQWFNELLSPTPWFKSVVPNFRIIPSAELPSYADSGSVFTSVCINTAVYLPYLIGQCRANGVVLKREVLKHISDAASLHASGSKADVVVNCTGLLASKLGGVMDKDVIPARGQIVVVRNTPGAMFTVSGTDDGDDEVSYIMQRAAGGGTILGGTYQKGSWESQPDPSTAIRIMKRAVELCPALTGGKGIEALSVIRHGVGLRPLREKGVRIETEKVEGVTVVHNYGHGGWGYQGSYGCAEGAKELVDEALKPKAKL